MMENKQVISGYTKLAAFVAKPAKHTISPLMHNTAFALKNIDARYVAFEIEKNALGRTIQMIRDIHMLGVNVSMPFKSEVIQYMDEVSEEVELIGAMNTVVNKNGYLKGYNTDGKGFMRSLLDEEIQVIGETITLLGCGGSAAAIAAQAALDGVKKIYVFNRLGHSYDNFLKKAKEISEVTNCQIILNSIEKKEALEQAINQSVLLVNASALGMKPLEKETPLQDEHLLRSDLAVVDIIYVPFETRLLKAAKAKGCKTANGLGMLIYQGAYAFELWTGQEMPIHEIKRVVAKKHPFANSVVIENLTKN